MGGGEETTILDFATWMTFYSLYANLKQGRNRLDILNYKNTKVCKKDTLDWSKFKFQNGLKPKTHILGTFWDKPLCCSWTQKNGNIFVDSKPCIRYGDFGNWV